MHATAPFICVNSCPADTEPPNQCACTAARLYETVAVAEYCDPATTVSMAQVTSPVQSCYDACKTFYSPALNSLDTFLFQLVNVNGQRECQCAETCQTVLTQPGAVLMGTCFPSTALQLKPTVSRRYLPANHAKRPVTLTYTLRVRGSAKNVQLSGMGVQVTLPPGSVVKAAKPKPATTQDGTVTWYPVAFRGKRTSTFRVKVTVSPPFAAGGLVFRSGVVQIADNLPTYPYCLLPASDMAVVAKTS